MTLNESFCLNSRLPLTEMASFCQNSIMANQSKEEIYLAVCNAILKMEVAKGHLAWTISDIARESDITRSLIYYYFGKEKEKVLEEAYKFIIANFFDIDRTKTVGIRDRLRQVLTDLKSMPYLLVLYYLEKHNNTEFGQMIHKAEALLLKNMKNEFPNFSEQQLLEIYLKELGAIAYQLPVEKVDTMFTDYI